MKIVALAIATLTALATPTLPYKTFSEAAKDSINADLGSCDGEHEAIRAFLKDAKGQGWMYVAEPETGKIVWYFYDKPEQGAKPLFYGTAKLDSVENDKVIAPRNWKRAGGDEDSPCAILSREPA
jgi:hypothetical protein